jgi:hypothetical protein
MHFPWSQQTSQLPPARYKHQTSELSSGKITHSAESHVYPNGRTQKRNTKARVDTITKLVLSTPCAKAPTRIKFSKSSECHLQTYPIQEGVHRVFQL